jgi:hypothetical protein
LKICRLYNATAEAAQARHRGRIARCRRTLAAYVASGRRAEHCPAAETAGR